MTLFYLIFDYTCWLYWIKERVETVISEALLIMRCSLLSE